MFPLVSLSFSACSLLWQIRLHRTTTSFILCTTILFYFHTGKLTSVQFSLPCWHAILQMYLSKLAAKENLFRSRGINYLKQCYSRVHDVLLMDFETCDECGEITFLGGFCKTLLRKATLASVGGRWAGYGDTQTGTERSNTKRQNNTVFQLRFEVLVSQWSETLRRPAKSSWPWI